MNHNPSDDSANVPPSGQAVVVGAASVREDRGDNSYQLNPSLQQALNCLDIKLEDELKRFRSKQEDRSPDLQPQTANTTWQTDGEILTADIVEPMMSPTVSAPTTSGFVIIDGLSTSSTNSRNALANLNYAPISLYRGNGSELPENLDLNFSQGGEIAPFHDEYLSSSQELLHQIRSGYANAAPSNDNRPQSASSTPKSKNLNPLKLGAVAAACLLAGGSTYVYLNPSLLAPLTATKVVTTTTTNSLGQLIQSPNLAANEFTELNLSTINTIKLPTATTNVSMATTSTMSTTQIGGATMPVAIPFNVMGSPVISPSTVITSQPKLADSLIKSLLPPNFQTIARRSNRTTPLGVKR